METAIKLRIDGQDFTQLMLNFCSSQMTQEFDKNLNQED